jgi:TPP-dependent pyruvate/acetoin dehydrogenase alpha subunit
MLQTVLDANPANEAATAHETTLAAYRFMLLARLLDDKFAALYRAGKIHGGVFLGRGQEALSAAIGVSLQKGDVFAPLIRDAAGRLAFGETVLDAVRTYLGSALGPMRGRDGNVHRGKPQEGYLPMISHLGAMISVVNGMLFARKLKKNFRNRRRDLRWRRRDFHRLISRSIEPGRRRKTAAHLGRGQQSIRLLDADHEQFACENLADKAIGYGVGAHSVDGTDLAACLKTLATLFPKQGQGKARNSSSPNCSAFAATANTTIPTTLIQN